MKGIFPVVEYALGVVIGDIGNAEILKYREKDLSPMAKGNRSVMGEMFSQEHIAVEAFHLRNGKDTDAPEGVCNRGEHFAFGNVSLQVRIRGALQAEHSDGAVNNVTFKGTAGDIRFFVRFKPAMHDQLVLHSAILDAANRGVTTMEAHKSLIQAVRKGILDFCLVEVGGHSVVDIQQGN